MLQSINTCTHVYDHAASLNLIYTFMHIHHLDVPSQNRTTEKNYTSGGRSKASSIIGYIKGIAPPNCLPDAPLASQMNTVIEELLCPVCLDVLCQPLELPCIALASVHHVHCAAVQGI